MEYSGWEIQNILRQIELRLENAVEEVSFEELEETALTVMPKQDVNYKGNYNDGKFDPEKFTETVLVILKDPKDTELRAVYTGYVVKKKRKQIMKEYGFTIKDYERIWKRLLYKLGHELPKEYKNMLSTSIDMHLIYNYYKYFHF